MDTHPDNLHNLIACSIDRQWSFNPTVTDWRVANVEPNTTILVVEDNQDLQRGLRMLLEAEGFRVNVASHGGEALESMQAQTPDLILSDISMPVMDGFSFLDAVRSHPDWVAIPVIFLTARSGREDMFASKRVGAEDFLVKPVNRQELLTTVRSRLSRSQQLLLVQLQHSYQSSLIMLSNAIELRDHYTRGHVERVMDYALIVGREMGLNNQNLDRLRFGSILHDVGKIHIRASILRKPGPLTDEEWKEMKQHPLLGAELIRNVPYLQAALPVVRHHHERWDGGGYPDGLAGTQIPLHARIVAVADSLDAMTTTRHYKRAFGKYEAYQDIIRNSGSRYDPTVVKAFQRVWSEIELYLPSPEM